MPVAEKLVWVQRYRMAQTNGQAYAGGGGWLRWDESVTSGDNGGTIFASTVSGAPSGRWVRDQVRDALDFGADPTFNYSTFTGPSSADALRNYLLWARDNQQPVVLPKGVFYIDQLDYEVTVLPGNIILTAFFKITNPTVAGTATRTVIRGAGMQQTILVIRDMIDATTPQTGDVFQIEECKRRAGAGGERNAVAYAANDNQGVTIRDLSILSRDGCEARGIVTIGQVDELRLFNLQFSWLGTALSLGMERIATGTGGTSIRAHLRESSFSNLHALHCGRKHADQTSKLAAIDLGSGAVNGGDGTNELFFDQCSVVYPEGIGINLENRSSVPDMETLQSVKVRRIRFLNLMLNGSSAKTQATRPAAPILRIKGLVDNVELLGVSLNGSTAFGTEAYACIAFEEFDASNRPRHIQILGDVRSCAGVGIDIGVGIAGVEKVQALHLDLTAAQATMGGNPVVRLQPDSVRDKQSVVVRALSGYGGSPPGAAVMVDPSVQDRVVVERSSGGITGLHLQRLLESSVSHPSYAAHYGDETLVVRMLNNNADWTLTLPPLSDCHPGRRFCVVDATERTAPPLIWIQAAGTDEVEQLPLPLLLAERWGKRVFQCIEVSGGKRWVVWKQ